ncbi:helix-turn-helix transcriptional regulator [Marinomonas polaris]|uniref:helix-turn-helix transcriptional regulator n=1 Tax=Marinomonas polaris TaxID=293552 RepID=UPI003F956F9A
MKMKGQLDSAQPLKKHKAKSKKNEQKKKKQDKLETKKHSKEKKDSQPEVIVSTEVVKLSTTDPQTPKKSKTKKAIESTIDDSIKNLAESPIIIEADAPESPSSTRQRASKSLEPMTKEEQLIAINQIIKSLLLDEMTQGAALRELRVGVLGIRQDAYTKLCGVSRKTLSEIENDKGNYTAEIINKVFKPFEIKVGLVPTSSQLLAAILTN